MQMELDKQYNLYAYHNAFADTIREIYTQITMNNTETARTLIILNCLYANAMTDRKRLDKATLEKMDIYELFVVMAEEQISAGLVPTQKSMTSSFYGRIVSKFKKTEG